MGIDGNKMCCGVINRGIDELPDDVLVNILSRTSLKEATRASVLARRWRYLWRFFNGTLQFERDTASGDAMQREKFESWVNTVLELHQSRYVEGIVINFEAKTDTSRFTSTTLNAIDSWVHFATQKQVKRFELNCSEFNSYEFPSIERLISHSHGVMSSSPLSHLRTLRLAKVDVEDEAVHYFLASCPNLEELSVHLSHRKMHVRVIDPPRLRILEIKMAYINVSTLEVSSASLVSLTYGGGEKSLVLKEIPNLRELTMTGGVGNSFFVRPKEHWSYSGQLEKLALDFITRSIYGAFVCCPDLPKLCSLKRLELQVFTYLSQSLVFFTSLINASPQLCEFRIEVNYHEFTPRATLNTLGTKEAETALKFVHGKLKVVEMGEFIGNWSEKELLLELLKIGPSIEKVVIDTKKNDGYYAYSYETSKMSYVHNLETDDEAKMHALNLASNLPEQVKWVVT